MSALRRVSDRRVAEGMDSPGRGLGQDSAVSQEALRAHLFGVMPSARVERSGSSLSRGFAVPDPRPLPPPTREDSDPHLIGLASARHREHLLPGRPHRLRVSYSDAELAAVRAGAARTGLTLSGFVAAAALAAATGEALPAPPC